MANQGTATVTIGELREFAQFAPAEQRYIRRSLDVALGRPDTYRRWARDAGEMVSIREQYEVYRMIDALRALRGDEDSLDGLEDIVGPLVRMAAFDLAQERLDSFSAFRFLYERLLGAWARPWLPTAFCGAAALPQIQPERRRLLLHSISEAAAMAQGWSPREPSFYPEWIEKEALA